VVSQTDIVRRLDRLQGNPEGGNDFYSQAQGDERVPGAKAPRAREFMNPRIIEVDEDAPVREIRLVMLRHRVHRVLVTRGDQIVGIVTTMDLLRVP